MRIEITAEDINICKCSDVNLATAMIEGLKEFRILVDGEVPFIVKGNEVESIFGNEKDK